MFPKNLRTDYTFRHKMEPQVTITSGFTCYEGEFTCFNWFNSRVSVREFTRFCGHLFHVKTCVQARVRTGS